jgi:hypothetical protein
MRARVQKSNSPARFGLSKERIVEDAFESMIETTLACTPPISTDAPSGRAAATPWPRAVMVIRVPPLHGQSTGDREGVGAMYLISKSTVMPADTMVP